MDAPTAWTPLAGTTHTIAVDVLINGPMSRIDLARRNGLSAGSLTRLTKPLIESGLLVERDNPGPSGVGRPTRPLDVVPDSHHFIGIKLTDTEAHGVLTNMRADVVAREVMEVTETSPEAVVDLIGELVDRLGRTGPAPRALGVSIGGKTDDRAVVVSARYLDWHDVPLAALARERTGLPTVIENDVTAWTEAEHWFGAGRGYSSFALVTIGVGVGYGLVMHDRLVAGPDSGVGLIGHIPLSASGPLCDEGHRGCASAMLSSSGIARTVAASLGRPVGYDEVFDLAREGHVVAARVVEESGSALGFLVALIANLTMVDKIIVTGDGVRLADEAGDRVRAAIETHRNAHARPVHVDVHHAEFTEWARGAAVVAIQTFVLGGD